MPGSVLSADLNICITCTILWYWGNFPWLNDLIFFSETTEDEWYLIVFILNVEYAETLRLLFFRDALIFSTFSETTGEKQNELGKEVLVRQSEKLLPAGGPGTVSCIFFSD